MGSAAIDDENKRVNRNVETKVAEALDAFTKRLESTLQRVRAAPASETIIIEREIAAKSGSTPTPNATLRRRPSTRKT